jgi:hypothetical protein
MIRVESRAEVWKGLSGGQVIGFMSEVMLVWVRVCRMHVRIVTVGTMFACVPCKYERSAFARHG